MIIVFDLDDTLYPEKTFFDSGVKSVAEYLSVEFKLDKGSLKKDMRKYYVENGRDGLFDFILSKNGLPQKKYVQKCLAIYRKHTPSIKPFSEAIHCLEQLSGYNKYLVTDGNLAVQRNKINTLGIKQYFIKTMPTSQYGLSNAKPSTYCFDLILKLELLEDCSKLVYVGDNPKKDFVNLKSKGYKTIRVLTGAYRDVKPQKKYEAAYLISSLKELTPKFIKSL